VADHRQAVLAFALTLPEAWEDRPWDETTVAKVGGKVFVFLAAAGRMTVKLDESGAHALSVDGAEPARYGLGRSGWVTVPLDASLDRELLLDWIEESYRIVAPRRLVAQLDADADRDRRSTLP
jgi:predicted DNA-binding protein (MmcQ/YjbR family)